LSLAEKYGEDHDGKVLIRKKYSQQRMADFLHANRTTVARVMKELSDLGLVERINDYYCIRDMDGLRRHMSEMESLP
jgi:CRP/FNR family transcriptional regulator